MNSEGKTREPQARFIVGESITIGAAVYLGRRSSADEPQLLTTDLKQADPRQLEPVGRIAPGPVFELNDRGEQLLKVLE